MAEHTYMREQVPANRTGQCSCCLKRHRSTKRGTLTRHGWQESGRRVGQWGCGFQWGACRGGSMRPLEQTDADALVILEELGKRIVGVATALKHHREDGLDGYTFRWVEDVHSFRKADHLDALLAMGLDVTVEDSRSKRKGHRVYYQAVRVFTFRVTMGADAVKVTGADLGVNGCGRSFERVTVPSYDDLRASYTRELEQAKLMLEAQRESIKEAVKQHRDNPTNGASDTKKRGKVIHWMRVITHRNFNPGSQHVTTRKRLACGSRGMSPRSSEDTSEVTCSRCKKAVLNG